MRHKQEEIKMSKMEQTRREFLRMAGKTMLGAAALTAVPAVMNAKAEEAIAAPAFPWTYPEGGLDVKEVQDRIYANFFAKGGCCAGVASGILDVLAEKYGYPYNQIDGRMFAHGGGGYGRRNLCGSLGGAFAVLYCFIIGKFVYKKLSFREHLIPILLDTIAGTSSVVLIMVSANVFGNYMSWINLPKIVAAAILNMTSNKYVFMMLCNVVLLIMGMFLEGGAALMIITPLLLPVARTLGINDYHFGLVALVNIMIGGITPPFGSMMFTTCGITQCPISEFLKEVWPYILCLFLVLMLLTFCPVLITIVPDLIYGPGML